MFLSAFSSNRPFTQVDSSNALSSFGNPAGRSIFQSGFEQLQLEADLRGRVEQIQAQIGTLEDSNPFKKIGEYKPLETLPPEVVEEILNYLDVADLYRLSQANHDWYARLRLRMSCDKEECELEICKGQKDRDRIWKEKIKQTFPKELKLYSRVLNNIRENWTEISKDYSFETQDFMKKFFNDPSSFDLEAELENVKNLAWVAKDLFMLKNLCKSEVTQVFRSLMFAGAFWTSFNIMGLLGNNMLNN